MSTRSSNSTLKTTMNRRAFLGAAAATSFFIARDSAWAVEEKVRRVGLIGSGWYGKQDLLRLIQVAPVEVVGLCDVDARMLQEASALVSQRQKSGKVPPLYKDYREMLKQEQPEIVLIGTPDHWHALPMIAAVESGADVYVQKPTGVDIAEGQAMLAAARKHQRVVQVGTQRRSTPHLIEAIKRVIEPGLLGRIGHVELCCYYHMRSRKNPPDSAPPEGLDWDFWVGPAPMAPYREGVHPRGWRAYKEFGNGIMGDMCVHMLDMVRWMLGLGWPKSVSSAGGIYIDPDSRANIPDTQTATFAFDDLNVVWTHRSWGRATDPDYPWAAFIYGEKGTLKLSVKSYDFIPQGSGDAIHGDCLYEREQYPEDVSEKGMEIHVAPANRRHQIDFLKAVDTRGRPVADIEEGTISTTCCLLANLALDLGRTLHWDPKTGRVIGDDEANARLKRPYRAPWKHPAG